MIVPDRETGRQTDRYKWENRHVEVERTDTKEIHDRRQTI